MKLTLYINDSRCHHRSRGFSQPTSSVSVALPHRLRSTTSSRERLTQHAAFSLQITSTYVRWTIHASLTSYLQAARAPSLLAASSARQCHLIIDNNPRRSHSSILLPSSCCSAILAVSCRQPFIHPLCILIFLPWQCQSYALCESYLLCCEPFKAFRRLALLPCHLCLVNLPRIEIYALINVLAPTHAGVHMLCITYKFFFTDDSEYLSCLVVSTDGEVLMKEKQKTNTQASKQKAGSKQKEKLPKKRKLQPSTSQRVPLSTSKSIFEDSENEDEPCNKDSRKSEYVRKLAREKNKVQNFWIHLKKKILHVSFIKKDIFLF